MAKQPRYEFLCMRCGEKTMLDGEPPRCAHCGHRTGVVTELSDGDKREAPKRDDQSRES